MLDITKFATVTVSRFIVLSIHYSFLNLLQGTSIAKNRDTNVLGLLK